MEPKRQQQSYIATSAIEPERWLLEISALASEEAARRKIDN
jgi:hypothetical protein